MTNEKGAAPSSAASLDALAPYAVAALEKAVPMLRAAITDETGTADTLAALAAALRARSASPAPASIPASVLVYVERAASNHEWNAKVYREEADRYAAADEPNTARGCRERAEREAAKAAEIRAWIASLAPRDAETSDDGLPSLNALERRFAAPDYSKECDVDDAPVCSVHGGYYAGWGATDGRCYEPTANKIVRLLISRLRRGEARSSSPAPTQPEGSETRETLEFASLPDASRLPGDGSR